jgi:hypothetical protein
MVVNLSSELSVKPGYGWGWFDESGTTVDVPGEFMASVNQTESRLIGQVLSGEFSDWVIELSPRHSPWDGDVNVILKKDKREVSGYASIPTEAIEL